MNSWKRVQPVVAIGRSHYLLKNAQEDLSIHKRAHVSLIAEKLEGGVSVLLLLI